MDINNFLNEIKKEIPKIPIGTNFRLRDVYKCPQAHLGVIFRKAIIDNVFKNIQYIGKDRESDIYKRIY